MVMLATTEATTSGPKLSIAIEPSTISDTNSAPPIGALYAEVIPAAAPQATSRRSWAGPKRAMRPASEAHIAARWTIEPSRPIDPPEATENSDEALRASAWRTGMRPSPIEIASM